MLDNEIMVKEIADKKTIFVCVSEVTARASNRGAISKFQWLT